MWPAWARTRHTQQRPPSQHCGLPPHMTVGCEPCHSCVAQQSSDLVRVGKRKILTNSVVFNTGLLLNNRRRPTIKKKQVLDITKIDLSIIPSPYQFITNI